MKKQTGFSLIELMVTMAILTIITAVAWPFYERYRVKVYRSECIAAMYIAFNDLDRCGARNGGIYETTDLAGNRNPCQITSLTPVAIGGGAFQSQNGRCTITPNIPIGGQGFTLRAALVIGNENNVIDDRDEIIAANAICGDLTLNNLNVKGRTNPAPNAPPISYCWDQ